jgi:hypothetical protein
MSQATRALVERLKKETSHLPGNAPMHNIALITICSILDELVEPVEEVEEAPVSEPEPAPEPEPAAEAPADESAGEEAAQDDGSGPMTTGNAPT